MLDALDKALNAEKTIYISEFDDSFAGSAFPDLLLCGVVLSDVADGKDDICGIETGEDDGALETETVMMMVLLSNDGVGGPVR